MTAPETPRLILASASPQRRAILEQIAVPFAVAPSGVEELEEGPAAEVVLENAYRKAAAVAAAGGDRANGLPILGVDTVVSLGGRLFGKPRDVAHAAEMLAALAGARHLVFSGVCVIDSDRVRTAAAETVVEFRSLTRAGIDRYVATGEWEGRAGAYAIQGIGATLVTRIEGDYLSVVGLPVSTLLDLMPQLAAG
ncbi:MAG: Maf family protein [Solirubrobacteraceae bacterium]